MKMSKGKYTSVMKSYYNEIIRPTRYTEENYDGQHRKINTYVLKTKKAPLHIEHDYFPSTLCLSVYGRLESSLSMGKLRITLKLKVEIRSTRSELRGLNVE